VERKIAEIPTATWQQLLPKKTLDTMGNGPVNQNPNLQPLTTEQPAYQQILGEMVILHVRPSGEVRETFRVSVVNTLDSSMSAIWDLKRGT